MLPIKHLINWLSIKAGFLAARWSAALKCAWTLCHNLPRSWHLIKWITLLRNSCCQSVLKLTTLYLKCAPPLSLLPDLLPCKALLHLLSALFISCFVWYHFWQVCEIWSLTRSHAQTHACAWVFQCHKKPSSFSTKHLNVLPLKKQMFTPINPEKWTKLLKCSAI